MNTTNGLTTPSSGSAATNNDATDGRPLREVIADIRARLTPKYGDGEARAMVRVIFESLKGWSPVDLAIRQDEMVSDFICGKIDGVVTRLMEYEPIQLIFGWAGFYGLKLKVTRDTLIPRPETAELVDIIVKENQAKDLKVLDAGTGSGCIAIALARNLNFPQVTAIDISQKALDVAAGNASALHARITFLKADILSLSQNGLADSSATGMVAAGGGPQFDIIVSNPPYIAEHEKAAMERNVLDFEPHQALFVPDDDPLIFYQAIMKAAVDGLLASGGRIYFEINPEYAGSLLKEAVQLGFTDAVLIRDTEGKQRFLKASLNP